MSAPAKSVYPILKSFADPLTGYAKTNYQLIAKYSGITSRTSISRAIKELQCMGLIVRIETPGKITKYKCRELFEIKNEAGEIVATSDFDYVPKLIKAATHELSNLVKMNVIEDMKPEFVNIERVIIDVCDEEIVENSREAGEDAQEH